MKKAYIKFALKLTMFQNNTQKIINSHFHFIHLLPYLFGISQSKDHLFSMNIELL